MFLGLGFALFSSFTFGKIKEEKSTKKEVHTSNMKSLPVTKKKNGHVKN